MILPMDVMDGADDSPDSGGDENLASSIGRDGVDLDVAVAELHRVYGRIHASSMYNVIQYIAVILAAGILAAGEVREAFVIVPLLWSAWMLYVLMVDRDTAKYALYAAWLEEHLNSRLTYNLFKWETRLSHRHYRRPLIFQVTWVYWGALNIASWVVGCVILERESGWWPWTYVLMLTAGVIWLTTGWTIVSRERDIERYRALIDQPSS
jgi:hypothetical protein